MDPDPNPGPTPFFSDKGCKKKLFAYFFFLQITHKQYIFSLKIKIICKNFVSKFY